MQEPKPPRAAGRLSRLAAAFAALAATLFLYLRNFALSGTPFVAVGDQNQFFARAVRILHGQVPYRDFFAFVTPGTEYLFAAGFRIFGIHAWVIAAWSIVTGLAFCWLLTRIATHILPGRQCLLPALLFLVFVYNGSPDLTHHWFSTLASLAAAGALLGEATLPRIASAGALCAVATLFTQTEGLADFIALVLYLVWLRFSSAHDRAAASLRAPSSLTAFILPFAAILAVVFGLFARTAGLHSLFFDLVLFAPRYLSSMGINSSGNYLRQFPPLHRPSDILHFIPVVFVYALVPYIYVIGLIQIVRKRASLSPVLQRNLVLFHLLGIALFVSIAHSARLFRLGTVAAPAVLICVWLLSGIGNIRALIRTVLAAVALAFALVLPIHRQAQRRVVLNLPVGRTAFTDPLSAREFRWLAAQSHPGESFFNNSALGLYLSLRNPTALEFINAREFTRPEWITDALGALERDPPRFLILQAPDHAPPASEDHTAPIRQFAQRNYRVAASFPLNEGVPYQDEIWERDPPPPHSLP